jgi:hypothetical protein
MRACVNYRGEGDSSTVGAFLSGTVMSRVNRSRGIAILGTIVMTAGVVLLRQLSQSISLAFVAGGTAIAGLGMGILFPAITVIAQNAVAPSHLGVGTGAVRYLGQIGGLAGIAIVGSVVNQSLAGDLRQRLPAPAMTDIVPTGVGARTETRVLTDPAYRDEQIQRATEVAVARVPAGPEHDQSVAIAAARARDHLSQAYEALRLSLAIAVQRGLAAALLFCGGVIIAACFVTDARPDYWSS